MVTVKVNFETIVLGNSILKCPSELHLDVSYQHIIQSTIRKWLNDIQPESEEKQRLLNIIDSKLEIEFNLADIRQDPGKYEVPEKVLHCNAALGIWKLCLWDLHISNDNFYNEKDWYFFTFNFLYRQTNWMTNRPIDP